MSADFGKIRFLVYIEVAVVGLVLGAISGALASKAFKLRIAALPIVADALLGAAAPIALMETVWQLELRHPFALEVIFDYNPIAAFIVAVGLPILHQLHRSKRGAGA